MVDLSIEFILANGDSALLVKFNGTKNRLVGIHALCENLLDRPQGGLINVIPASDSLTLVFSGSAPDCGDVRQDLENRCRQLSHHKIVSKIHEIPVCYDPELAADITAVADSLSVTIEQVIEWHTRPQYVVAMLGFLPGFAYLNGNHEKLVTSRKATPAVSVPPGSIAVAGRQTGIYALNSPGGWQVIGRTYLDMIDWHNEPHPMRLKPLDRVSFKAISLDAFKSLGMKP